MISKNLLPRGMKSSYNGCIECNLEELLESTEALPVSFLVDYENKEHYYEDFLNESVARAFDLKNRKRNSLQKMVPINEMTQREILRGVDSKRLERSKKLTTKYIGVTPKKGWIKFLTNSQYLPGVKYTQYIELAEAKDIKYFKEFKKQDIIRLFMSGDIKIYCSCLREGTRVKLLDGTNPTIEELLCRYNSGEELWVYSVDPQGNFKPGKINKVFISGVSQRFVRVTLDSGEVIDTTENHLYMTRDGKYKKAGKLSVGDSLMPLYFKNTEKDGSGYTLVKFNKWPDGYHSVYKEVAKSVFSEDEWQEAKDRSGEDVIVIHHKDYNKQNNVPKNLKLMGRQEHIKFHAKLLRDRFENDPEFRRKNEEAIHEHMLKLNANPTEAMIAQRKIWVERGRQVCNTQEWREAQSEVMKVVINEYWNNLSPEERSERQRKIFEDHPELKEIQSKKRKEYWEDIPVEERRERNKKSMEAMSLASREKYKNMSDDEKRECYRKRVIKRYKRLIDNMIEQNVPLTTYNFVRFEYANYKKYGVVRKLGVFQSLEDILEYLGEPYSTFNHKVVKIEYIDAEPELVYDLSVDKYHNYCLDAGIIVHNCPDFKYRHTYQAYQMGYGIRKENRFPKIVNRNLEGSCCKHLIVVLSSIMFNWSSIAKDMRRTKFFNIRYNEDDYEEEIKKERLRAKDIRQKKKSKKK